MPERLKCELPWYLRLYGQFYNLSPVVSASILIAGTDVSFKQVTTQNIELSQT